MSAVNPRPDGRARLLEAAARVLAADGPSGLTVSRLAREVGTSTMALYSNFSGKDELIAATADEFVSRFSAALRVIPRNDDALTEFIELARAYREISLANPHLYRVAFHSGRLSVLEDTPRGMADIYAYVAEVLARCVARGVFPGGEPIPMLLQLWTAIHGQISLELEKVFPSREVANASWDALFRALLVGLGADSADVAGRDLMTGVPPPAEEASPRPRPKRKRPTRSSRAS